MAANDPLLHLAYSDWPAADRMLWEQATSSDDPFADAARLAKSTKCGYWFGYRRLLGFLAIHEPAALEIAPAERLTVERVKRFAAHLVETNIPYSVAKAVDALFLAVRMMMLDRDWSWLKALKGRLYAVVPARTPAGPVITSV